MPALLFNPSWMPRTRLLSPSDTGVFVLPLLKVLRQQYRTDWINWYCCQLNRINCYRLRDRSVDSSLGWTMMDSSYRLDIFIVSKYWAGFVESSRFDMGRCYPPNHYFQLYSNHFNIYSVNLYAFNEPWMRNGIKNLVYPPYQKISCFNLWVIGNDAVYYNAIFARSYS